MAQDWKLKGSVTASCTEEEFYSGVDVWVRRPNVVNRKLLGAMIQLEGPLSASWMSKDLDQVTVGELLQQPEQEGVADGSRIVVRELLPRSSGHVQRPTSLELVVTGRF
jgi:hypothetical protein